MLALLTSKWRRRAAALVAALFALSLLAPVAAFALTPMPAHCLEMASGAPVAGAEHGHHRDGDAHASHMSHGDVDHAAQASTGDSDPTVPLTCCNLFSVTALTPAAAPTPEVVWVTTTEVALPAAKNLLGRSPGGIDRPPRSLPSF